MKERFEGESGAANLEDSLLRQKFVQGDPGLAERLRRSGKVVEFANDEPFIHQGATDTDVYLLLAGKAQVFVNRRLVGVRTAGEAIGEMVAVNSALTRTATVKADGTLVALKVSASDFIKAGEASPKFWQHIARTTGERLADREKFLRPSNDIPRMFIASSVQGIPLARAIEAGLKHERDVEVVPWFAQGVFGPSRSPIDSLLRQVDSCDFALFIFGPDDRIAVAETEMQAPRDNVIFELGLFMGRLGPDRTFIVCQNASQLKVPTDLLGVTPIEYVVKPADAAPKQYVGPVCSEILDAIRDRGVL